MAPLISNISEIISFLDTQAEIINEKNHLQIHRFESLKNSQEGDMTFCVYTNQSGIDLINQSKASIIICSIELPVNQLHSNATLILVKNPRLYFIKCVKKFASKNLIPKIHQNTIIKTNNIGKNVSIGPFCYIEENVVIGDNCTIFGGVQIFNGTKIGNNTRIFPSVIIGDASFGPQRSKSMTLETCDHLGGVVIGNNVEIGSNTSILPGMIDDTIIGDGTKISSQVYIGSGMKIGNNCMITGHTWFGGMSILEDNVYVAPGAIIRNKIKISKNAFVGMGSVIIKDVSENTTVIGIPGKSIDYNSDGNAINNIR